MANKLSWMLIAILPACALAQQQSQLQPSSQPNYLDEMAKLDAQIAYVQKKTELRDVLKKSSSNEGLPRILSILVDGKGGSAQVVYNSGVVRWIKKGDFLQDGMQVLAITKSSVQAGGRGGKFSLAFYSAQPMTAADTSGPLPGVPRINIPLPQAPTITPALAAAPQSVKQASPASSTALPAIK